MGFPRNHSSTLVLSSMYTLFFREISSKASSIVYNLLTPKSLAKAPCSKHHRYPRGYQIQLSMSEQNSLLLPGSAPPGPSYTQSSERRSRVTDLLPLHSLTRTRLFSLYSTLSQALAQPSALLFWTTIPASSMVSRPPMYPRIPGHALPWLKHGSIMCPTPPLNLLMASHHP